MSEPKRPALNVPPVFEFNVKKKTSRKVDLSKSVEHPFLTELVIFNDDAGGNPIPCEC